jgi:hypothetical protein
MNPQQYKREYFEDFETGTTFKFVVPGLNLDEIKAFANNTIRSVFMLTKMLLQRPTSVDSSHQASRPS